MILGEKGEIIALEPVPSNMKLLNMNLKLNKNNITKTMQVGLSNTSESKDFLLSEHSNLGHITDNGSYENKKKIKIKVISLKELIKKKFCPDFIRMDIEGYEEKVLEDLTNLKLKQYPIICFETHRTKYKNMRTILNKLFSKGYFVKYASSSYEEGSLKVERLGYKPIIQNISTDDVYRNIYINLKKEDALELICKIGGLRTIVLSPKNR